MPTLNQAVAAIDRHIGFPTSRARQVARRLQEAAVLPVGAPGLAPELDVDHVINLIIALAADTTLHAAADAVAHYRALGLPGHDATGLPASLAARYHSAGDHLDVLADMALHGEADTRSDVAKMRIEVVSTWPEVAITYSDGSVDRFREAAALTGHWRTSGHRKSTTIAGGALVDAVRELFSEK